MSELPIQPVTYLKTVLFLVRCEPYSLREVIITSVLDEDPPCVVVGGLCKIPLV